MTLLVQQLRFTRDKWQQGFRHVSEDDAQRRFENLNPIGWQAGHLAFHEQLIWCEVAQDKLVVPDVKLCGWGEAPSSPSLAAMMTAWEQIIPVADIYLNTLISADMERFITHRGRQYGENIGTMLLRQIYHYWYHLGEVQAIRQLLGHTIDSYVGRMPPDAHYFVDSRYQS